jgi:hypothetical protein
MKNLAGIVDADMFIQEELLLAGIPIIHVKKGKNEVPYSIQGKLGSWTFERAWHYWNAQAPDGKGLTLRVATLLHQRKYPIEGKDQPQTYGEVIRVDDNCTCPHPKYWAFPEETVRIKELDRLGKKSVTYRELAELCNKGTVHGPRFVNLYAIDEQLALNEFARVIRG